ncbi:hypothetical protein DPMN_051861 [Dreissena polymorpha]|uniref:Uncharacterized protein n=1 Tax=Dreissena polymorpha TaxID=45954 RepID=A0A9D4CKS5_DREPO|nr:hypothetical protein DPMN_051861 [Dreissena polymorpha]
MEVSTEKSKSSTTNTRTGITINGENLEEVTSLKYLGVNLAKDGTNTAEVPIRSAMVGFGQAVPSSPPPSTGSTISS